MTVVVAIKEARAPAPTRKVVVFCVQSYWRDRGRLAKGRFQQMGSMESALRAGSAASVKAAGVLVYRLSGYVGTDVWSEPCVVARYGEVSAEIL